MNLNRRSTLLGAVAQAPADGYALLMGTNSTNAANGALFKELSDDPEKDFAPIARVVMGVDALVVSPELPVNSVAELIGMAKKNPGKLNYSEASASQRLSAEMFNQLAGVQIERVPCKSSPQALGDVAAGQVHVMFPDLPQAFTQIEAAKDAAPAKAMTQGRMEVSVIGLDEFGTFVKSETVWWTKSIKAAGIEPE